MATYDVIVRPSGDGSKAGTWVYSSGTTGYNLVNEVTAVDTSYIECQTSGTSIHMFSFPVQSIPAGARVLSVTVYYRSKDKTAGVNKVSGRITVGGVAYPGTDVEAPSTFTINSSTWAINPKTGSAWTVDDVNGVGLNNLMSFGIIHTDGNPAIQTSQVWMQIRYNDNPTIGLLSKGSYSFVDTADVIVLTKVAMPSGGGTGNSVAGYFQANGTAGNVKLLIYAADGSDGNAGTRLFVSSALPLTTSEAWVTDSLSGLSLPGGSYWIGFVSDVQIRAWVNPGAGDLVENKDISNGYASPPSTYPDPQYSDTALLSIYIDYTAASAAVDIDAAIGGVSSISGAPDLVDNVTVAVDGSSEVSGDAAAIADISAAAEGLSDVAGSASAVTDITSSIDGVSSVSGDPDFVDAVTVAVDGVSDVSGDAAVVTDISAFVDGVSLVSGDPDQGAPVADDVTAAVDGVSIVSADPAVVDDVTAALDGASAAVDGTSEVTGTASTVVDADASVSGVSAGLGDPDHLDSLAAPVAGQTVVTAEGVLVSDVGVEITGIVTVSGTLAGDNDVVGLLVAEVFITDPPFVLLTLDDVLAADVAVSDWLQAVEVTIE